MCHSIRDWKDEKLAVCSTSNSIAVVGTATLSNRNASPAADNAVKTVFPVVAR